LEPDFFKRQKKIQKEEKQRSKGATSYTKGRKRELKRKESKAEKYRLVRKKNEKFQKKQDAIFEQQMLEPEGDQSKRRKQGQRYAKKKRKQDSQTWKEQNLEHNIEVQKANLLKKKESKKNTDD
jgi:hypothetical protein